MKAISHTHIIHAVLLVCLWLNDSMAVTEWPVWNSDNPTKRLTLPRHHLVVFTALTATYTIISARSILHLPWDLPAAAKGHSPLCFRPRGRYEIIRWVAIEIATEAAGLTSVAVGQRDHKLVFPVVSYGETKVSLDDYRATAVKHAEFIVVQGNRQTPQNVIDLQEGEQKKTNALSDNTYCLSIKYLTKNILP